MLDLYVDADGCPVKDEIYKVTGRYGIRVILVANQWMRIPPGKRFRLVEVDDDFDAADNWIVENVSPGDIVVTADIPLAGRCLEKGARVLGPRGRPFTEENIGDALASRELMSELRESGIATGGPPPFGKKDRSQFLQSLDDLIQAIRRGK